MKRSHFKYFVALMLLIGLFSCKSDSLHKEIKSMAIDNDISEREFNDLLKYAGSDPKLHKYTDPKALYEYLTDEFRTANPPVTIWNPNPQAQVSKAFNVSVYLENSYSIDGYVQETDMKNAVYEMLGNIKTVCDTLNLNYINNKILNPVKNAQSADTKAFILNLTPQTFLKKGGNRGTSDMAEIIDTVLSKTNKATLSVLISDFVFSPGSGVNAADYLDIQKTSIRDLLRDKLKNQSLAVAAYQMNADFNGDYFDHNNKRIRYNGKRPYYIWFIGAEDQVKTLMDKQVIPRNGNGYLNRVVFVSTKNVLTANHQLEKMGDPGSFSLNAKPDEINQAVAANGAFGFSIAVDFSHDLRDEKYFLDAANYVLSDNSYTLTARVLTYQEKQSAALAGYTHLITLKSNRLISQDLDIKIISRPPSWIEESNSMNDSDISNNTTEQSKTFGLNYLMRGVMEAFNANPNMQENILYEFTIKINK